jgi:ABC-type sugar transport system substrate-binding protein
MRYGKRIRLSARSVVALGSTVAVAGALAACGSESSTTGDTGTSASASTASSATTAAGGSAAYVAQAQKITKEAETALVYAPTNDFSGPDELKPSTTWLGPTSAPPLAKGKSIAFVSCGAGACNEAVQVGAKIAKQAGFKASVFNINGTGDVQNLNESMSSALAAHPDAIVTMAIAATQVAPKLEQAKSQGIITVSAADPTPPGGKGRYDAAADYPNGLSTELLGWGIVGSTDGKANVVAINDQSFPAVVRKIGNLVKVVEGCSTCKVKKVTWQVTDALDSAKAANIITGVINSNPDMNVLALPYSIGLPSIIQAVKSSGRDIAIYADDSDAVNLATLRKGISRMVSAVDPELVMYQAVDQVNRGLNKSPYVEPANLPYLAHLYTKDTAPVTGVGGFLKFFDYPSVYAKLWK